jgi:thermitase
MKRTLLYFLVLITLNNRFIEKGYGQTVPDYAPGSLIIKFTKQATIQPNFQLRMSNGSVLAGITSIDSLNMLYNIKSFHPAYFELYNPVADIKLGKDREYVLQFPAETDIEKLANIYNRNSFIEEAYPNYIFYTTRVPDDPLYSAQWALTKISAPYAWDIQTGNSEIVIGILDTGVDLAHPDLQSKLVPGRDEVSINTSYYLSLGYVLHSEEDYTQPDNDPSDAWGHGTNVAGIAAATTDNGKGIAGVAWDCKIMPIRAGFGILHPSTGWIGGFELDDLIRALDWATNSHAAHVINMSFGTYNEDAAILLFPSIANAYNAGITLIAASGNNNTTTRNYPAAFDNYVIAVGATNQSDDRCDPGDWGGSYGSNYGSWLDVVAPGIDIYSTSYDIYSDYHSYGYYYFGTSMAVPHVSGVAALMHSVSPNLTPAAIRKGIENTADKVTGMGGQNFHNEYGYGRLNAYEAVNEVPKPPTNLYISGYQGGMPRINWTASTSPDIDYYELWWWQYYPPQGWQLLTTTPATSWVDSRVTIDLYGPEDTYCYKALAVDDDGLKSDFSNSDCVNVDESPPWGKPAGPDNTEMAIPETYSLGPNFPNPFNPTTTIRYDLPEDSFTELRIYDLMGREYHISFISQESYLQFSQTRKMVLLR